MPNIEGMLLGLATAAMADVPECRGWAVEYTFGPLDRLQSGPREHYVFITCPGPSGGGVLIRERDLDKGAVQVTRRLRAAARDYAARALEAAAWKAEHPDG